MEVSFVSSDLFRIWKASWKVFDAAMRQAAEMPKRGSRQYAQNVIQAINAQKYGWARHSVYYEGWKYLHGFSPKKWVLSGELLQAINSYPLKVNIGTGSTRTTEYFSGIPWEIKDSGGKNFFRNQPPQNIAWYARMLEYGRKGQPPRPLFRPEFEAFKGIWKLNMFKAKGQIRRAWH